MSDAGAAGVGGLLVEPLPAFLGGADASGDRRPFFGLSRSGLRFALFGGGHGLKSLIRGVQRKRFAIRFEIKRVSRVALF